MQTTKRGVIAWFASNPVAANLLMVLLLVAGIATAVGLRKEAFPPLAPRFITVTVPFPSGSAKQAEEGIALKIEDELIGLSGLKQISTTSTADGVSVWIERESGYDLDKLLNDVKTRIDGIPFLPERAEKPIVTREEFEEHAAWVQLYGDVDQATLQTLIRDLRDVLMAQPAITKANLSGLLEPEISIELDEHTLQAHGLSLSEVANIVSAESFTEISGQLRGEDGFVALKADQQGYYGFDFSSIVLRSNADGSYLKLGDIARVRDGYAEAPRSFMRFQGQRAVGIELVMDGRGDIMAISEQAREVITEWKASNRLPEGVQIATWYDQSQVIQSRLELMTRNGLSGIVLVFVVLSLFLNLRIALWVAASLPVCFAGTLWLMGDGFLGLSINELTTFGFIIALGILVDDAVVVGESVYRTRREEGESLDNTVRGVHRVAVPTIFGVLTTVAAFAPLSFIEGDMGQIFSQFAVVVVASLLFSIVESKLILPAHLAHINTRAVPKWALGRFWKWVQARVDDGLFWFHGRVYIPMLDRLLSFRYATLAVAVAGALLVGGLVTRGVVRSVFFPDIPGNVVSAELTLMSEAGFGLTERHAEVLENKLHEVNQNFMDELGLENSLLRAVQVNMSGDSSVSVIGELVPSEERTVTAHQMTSAWREAVGTLEATKILKFVGSWQGFEDLRIELLANDQQQLVAAGAAMSEALTTIAGVEDIRDDLDTGQGQIQLTLTAEGRARGLTTADLAGQIQQAYYGYEVQRVQRGREEVKVRVRYPADQRADVSNLDQARIRTPQGDVVPLQTVARFKSGYESTEINRLDGQRATVITADVDKNITSPNDVLAQLNQEVFPHLQATYPGLRIQLGGEAREDAKSTESLGRLFLVSLLMIFGLLAVPLKSYLQPLVIMFVIPFGLVGAVMGHYVTGLPISLLSMFGFLALCGVVVNDSLILVSAFNEFRKKHDLKEALARAGGSRMRAILLTSLTTYAGLIPLLSEKSEQAQYLIPVATSLSYGVLFATGITLILVPVLLHILEDVRGFFKITTVAPETAEAA